MFAKQSMTGLAAVTALALAGAAWAEPAPRTTMLGSRPQEVYLAKITVSDLPRSYDFYTRVIGLKRATGPGVPPQAPPSASDPERDFVEIPLNFSGSLADPIFVLVKRRGETPTPEAVRMVTIGFKTPDAHAAAQRVAAAGYGAPARETGAGPLKFAVVADPDGYAIEFVQAPSYGDGR